MDPKKLDQLRGWPAYQNCTDIHSHIAFCNYLREFYGPEYSERTQALRKYQKKGADFSMYANDTEAQQAREWLISTLIESIVLVVPDWEAASKPWLSGRPFEAYIDASDISWCVILCQRDTPGGTPRPIAMVCKSFTDEATRWSAFEREYYAFKEGFNAISKWVEGFTLSLIHI